MTRKNSRFRFTALLALACATLLAGCAGSKTPTVYYSLYAPTLHGAEASMTDGDISVSVGPVIIPDILKQTRIATGGADGSYDLTEYHRWSGDVDRDLARALAEHLAQALGTQRVSVFPWDQDFTPTYQVLVDVLFMGGEPGGEAILSARWNIINKAGKEGSSTRRIDLREVSAGPDVAQWVAAQQLNVEKLGEAIAQTISEIRK
ncbi:PqiC family protein [Desulfomicrobium baculatum]|uniref:ABC-type transport auxiliary lipoprotein component domain-containing protein n=1 Tax=Desulfomicrobium baculatum (strain DSM 4028 / VKM B-1378 / X) TaxID=525897 RepID=C7LVB2_DESBD|nr:PqiC family protein [Desulfomicrobium baculatum]ACU88454.1 protein of unknown function DUF330 [Desulfomicrobium baculatum DSM 4028]